MLVNNKTSGKHMISDIKEIKNIELLNNPNEIRNILNNICKKYNFIILNKSEHLFSPQGFTIIYLLSESHISIHTFPEHQYLAFDIYTCRNYNNDDIYKEIYNHLVEEFEAKKENPIIIDRNF
jgi:S-adenosylmethionine decarboxylase proenzyme